MSDSYDLSSDEEEPTVELLTQKLNRTWKLYGQQAEELNNRLNDLRNSYAEIPYVSRDILYTDIRELASLDKAISRIYNHPLKHHEEAYNNIVAECKTLNPLDDKECQRLNELHTIYFDLSIDNSNKSLYLLLTDIFSRNYPVLNAEKFNRLRQRFDALPVDKPLWGTMNGINQDFKNLCVEYVYKITREE